MSGKKFPILPEDSKTLWTKPPPKTDDSHKLPTGMTEVVRLVDGFPRYIVEITAPCSIAGKPAQPGERYETFANDAGAIVCSGRGKLIETIPPATGTKIRKLDDAPQPAEGPRVCKL